MRTEFSKPVKREALKRSGGNCEAKGTIYGMKSNERCFANLAYGVEFDHWIPDSIGGKPELDNCVAVCKQCHSFKTRNTDTPRAAKTVRMSDKHRGITRSKQKIKSRGFKKYVSNTKYVNEGY